MRKRGLITLLGALAIGGAGTAAAVSCGDWITSNLTLTSDLTGCPAEGLFIGADNVTINLNGHTISGTGSSAAINVLANKGVRIVGPGTLRHFATGVAAGTGKDHYIGDLIIEDVDTGIYWRDVYQSKIESLYIKPQFNGLTLDGVDADFNEIVDNYVEGGAGEAIWIRGGAENFLRSNYLLRNQTGFAVSGGDNNRFEANHLIENVIGALLAKGDSVVGPANGNQIVGNKIYDNQQGIFVTAYGDSSWMKYNEVQGNAIRGGDQGLVISARNYKTRVIDNYFWAHSSFDIDDSGTRTVFSGNRCSGAPCP